MGFLKPNERATLETLSRLSYCNPFLPERIELEKQVLGDALPQRVSVWNLRAGVEREREAVVKLQKVVDPLADDLLNRLRDGVKANDDEARLYEDLILFVLYHRYRDAFQKLLDHALDKGATGRVKFYEQFEQDAMRLLDVPGVNLHARDEVPHLFACYFQLRRAFHHIFSNIVGGSMPAARLRAAVWQSIFTHDMPRYRRALFNKLGDIATLITGPTGTGKELVARAIALSRYIPFDAGTQRFSDEFTGSFHALNLSALSPTLIESELFGHRRGSFTGAVADRTGWLELCKPLGTVFLDEIGELDSAIQVKLLRLLQTRTFQKLGDTKTLHFSGKIMAATNRDLMEEMQQQRFRQDFFYRLCADMIRTPSLSEQLIDSPEELPNLVLFIARRLAGDEAETLTDEVVDWIENHLGLDYAWPGNIRELEQCIKNVMIRKEYRPQHPNGREAVGDVRTRIADEMLEGEISADDLIRRYVTIVYAQTGSYEAAARKLGLDRRTVKARVDEALLEALQNESP